MVWYGELVVFAVEEGAIQKLAQEGALRGRPQVQFGEGATEVGGGPSLGMPSFALAQLRERQAARSWDGNHSGHKASWPRGLSVSRGVLYKDDCLVTERTLPEWVKNNNAPWVNNGWTEGELCGHTKPRSDGKPKS